MKPLASYWLSYYDYDENLLKQERLWIERDHDIQRQVEHATRVALKRFKNSELVNYSAVLSVDPEPDFQDFTNIIADWDRSDFLPKSTVEMRLDAESILASI